MSSTVSAAAETVTAPLYSVYSAEAETLAGVGGVSVVDTTASKGKAMLLFWNATITRPSVTPSAIDISVRARGDQCQGAPQMVVTIDGVSVLSTPVPASTWTNYTAPLTLSAGPHAISVGFTNDFAVAGGCDRNLRVDSLTMHSDQPINTGTPGSTCQGSDGGIAPIPPLESGTSNTWLGKGPAYYEAGSPTGAFLGAPAKGVMLIIHGGGWFVVGPNAVGAARSEADVWRARGWATLNVDYRACSGAMLSDVIWAYDMARVIANGRSVCASGASAGGHLALLLASQKPLACVINQSGPSDLVALPTQTAYDPVSGGTQSAGPIWNYNLAVAAFGVDQLLALSPSSASATITARILQSSAANDPFVGAAQALSLQTLLQLLRPLTWNQVYSLAPGTVPWVHASASQAAIDAYRSLEVQLVTGL